MTFAKYTMFELIRAIRRLGTVGLFIMGLLVGSTLIAAFSDGPDNGQQGRFTAEAAVNRVPLESALPSQPWSRVLGGQPFEKITDVALTPGNRLVFAGLSLGVEHGQSSQAMLVSTGPNGFVQTQVRVSDPSIGSVSRAVLDPQGEARLVHWHGSNPGFSRTNAEGEVIWSRVFNVDNHQAWADIKDARNGHSLAALASGPGEQADLRVVRLDEAGKVVWRGTLANVGEVETLHMYDSGDGGALVAMETLADGDLRTISLARLDRRGRLAWQRELLRGVDARLADAALDPEGSVILLAGAPSALIRFDGLGQLSWMRDLPDLSLVGRHLIAPMEDGGVQVMAEPATSGLARRHWVARFNPDGREIWSRTRANRSNATLEAARIAPNGMIIAGGSMVASSAGDTDMLMITMASDGTFPQGFGTALNYDPRDRAPEPGEVEPEQPMLAASLVVDGSLALESAFAADMAALQARGRSPSVRATPRETSAIALAPEPEAGEAMADVETALAPAEGPDTAPALREVSARADIAALAIAPVEAARAANAPASGAPAPGARDVEELAAGQDASGAGPVAGSIASTTMRGLDEESPLSAEQTAWSPRGERPAYAYQCTFTCLADSQDMVKYPVTRIIANVAEDNASLVSLDVMAMDNGICLATGGRVYDDPRLPPVCERVN